MVKFMYINIHKLHHKCTQTQTNTHLHAHTHNHKHPFTRLDQKIHFYYPRKVDWEIWKISLSGMIVLDSLQHG